MRIACTGNLGFICSHLVDYLVDKGHEVAGIDYGTNHDFLNKDIKFYNIDIRDEEAMNKAFAEFKPEIVYHLAAVSRTPDAVNNPVKSVSINDLGSTVVLETARRFGVQKVVLASSNIVYAAETTYRSSKLAMELHARVYDSLYKLPTVCLRFSNVAGSNRQHEDNVLAALSKSKKEKGRLTITGDGSQTRNFTYVMDVCEALWLASQSDVRGTELDIMHPKTWELNQIAKMFDCPIDYIEDREGDIKHLKMGIGPEKAKELIGFEAKTDLTEYIKVYTE